MCFAARSEATVYNSDGSAANVQALHNGASNGDTITLPVGTFTWATGVSFTKSITLQGAGVGHTIVRDGVNGPSLISWNYSATQNARPRLTGIEFQHGGRPTYKSGP